MVWHDPRDRLLDYPLFFSTILFSDSCQIYCFLCSFSQFFQAATMRGESHLVAWSGKRDLLLIYALFFQKYYFRILVEAITFSTFSKNYFLFLTIAFSTFSNNCFQYFFVYFYPGGNIHLLAWRGQHDRLLIYPLYFKKPVFDFFFSVAFRTFPFIFTQAATLHGESHLVAWCKIPTFSRLFARLFTSF